ncbi:MAG: recombinase family protein, partial [Faecalibacterium sp.]
YVFDDRVVLNFNFTDDAKTVTREEVLGSSAVDNAPPLKDYPNLRPIGQGFGFLLFIEDIIL